MINQHAVIKSLVGVRWDILVFLVSNGQKNVTEIAKYCQISCSAISHQLIYLRKNGLVKFRKIGKNVYYSVEPLSQMSNVILAVNGLTKYLNEKGEMDVRKNN